MFCYRAVSLLAVGLPLILSPVQAQETVPREPVSLVAPEVGPVTNPRLLVSTNVGYGEDFSGAQFTPDGTAILTWGGDWGDPNKPDREQVGWLQLRDKKNGNRIRSFEGHTALVRQGQFSSDGGLLVSASHDGMILLWDVASGRLLHTFAPAKPVTLGPK